MTQPQPPHQLQPLDFERLYHAHSASWPTTPPEIWKHIAEEHHLAFNPNIKSSPHKVHMQLHLIYYTQVCPEHTHIHTGELRK